jgi:hypothetical protein
MRLALPYRMTPIALRAALIAAVIAGTGACAQRAPEPILFGPELGQSTASGPADPTLRPPPTPGVTETSVHLQGLPGATASPAQTAEAESASPTQPTPGLIVTIPTPAPASAGATSGTPPAPATTAPPAPATPPTPPR